MLEDAVGPPGCGFGEAAGRDALIRERDDLAGLYLADEGCADDIQRDGFGGDDGGAVREFAQREGAPPPGVAGALDLVLREEDHREGALESAQRCGDRVGVVFECGCDELEDGLGVGSGVEGVPGVFEFGAEVGGVGDIAVVGEGELPRLNVGDERWALRLAESPVVE